MAAQACDLAIVGAGAAGLAAAIFTAEAARAAGSAIEIVILESAAKIGAKILISGGGRCNITNSEVGVEDFNGSRHPIRNILAAFDQRAAASWFESIGVRLKREAGGKLFPVSDRARTVVDALVARCDQLGVRIVIGRRVEKIARLPIEAGAGGASDRRPHRFAIHYRDGELRAHSVVLATGGRSLPRTGSDGSGWKIVAELGHTVTATHPALVPLKLDRNLFHAELSGLSVQVDLTVTADDRLVDRRVGSLLWTHFGISGPVVMDASRHWIAARLRSAGAKVRLRCNFIPDNNRESAEAWLLEAAAAHPRMTLRRLLAERISERLAAALTRWCAIDDALGAGQLPRAHRRRLVEALVAFELPVIGDRGWDFAEVTAGGVPLAELDYRTMESRRVPGLYLIGELLDCDGRIGGYNFQWAWATGFLAGRAAASVKSSSPTLATADRSRH
ncbi:MAG TPA: aminoacetone oxidase family FAD-binding enzyme [Candidatus Binataceae bacterium]|nr:aminoacetone oxidase family FAD-binding enzyme [Candidatus Binataceae bacterium]